MSSTARGASRENLDFYPTPGWCVDLLLDALNVCPEWRCLEPAAGDGAIVKRLLARGVPASGIGAVEIDPTRAEKVHEIVTCECSDFLKDPPIVGCHELIVTNPPFALAADFAKTALFLAGDRGTVALLLRLNWLGSQERAAFHREHPSDILLLPKRPEFTASMSCSGVVPSVSGRRKKGDPPPVRRPRCEWRATLPIDAPRPAVCPSCGAKALCSTTDSIEYAWFVWGPGRGNRWSILPMPDTKGA